MHRDRAEEQDVATRLASKPWHIGCETVGKLRRRRLTLSFPALPDHFVGRRIALISDLHLRRRTPMFTALVEVLRKESFDLGCCAGDLEHAPDMDMTCPLALAGELFAAAAPPLGWFVVRGNNDHRRFMVRLGETCCTLLTNQAVQVGNGEPPVWLAGVDDPHKEHDDLDAALADVPADAFRIVLAHTPDVVHDATRRGVDLLLAGHTHGGQIRLPWIGPVLTQLRVGREYCWGLARKGRTRVFTTCGVGWTILPIRINCPPEVVFITLRRGDAPPVDTFDAPVL